LNNLHFVVEHSKAKKEKNVFQILYQLGVKLAFLYFGIKASLAKILKYFFYMPVMFRHVI